jgi:phage protein U
MAIVLMQLGGFRFSVPGLSYDRLHRRWEYRWEPMMRVGRRPSEQFMGPGEEMLDIRGIIYPHYAGGYNQLNVMRNYAQIGTPLGLAGVSGGIGIYYGPWCIRMIRDEQEYFHPNGDPRKVEFSISMDLVAYGPEAPNDGFGLIREPFPGSPFAR